MRIAILGADEPDLARPIGAEYVDWESTVSRRMRASGRGVAPRVKAQAMPLLSSGPWLARAWR